jgi:ubiquinone/menaquinone biosynthesis C-methylase UbiE
MAVPQNASSDELDGDVIHQPRLYEFVTTAVFLGRRKGIWDKLVVASCVVRGDRVLDVGCGTGYFTRLLAATAVPGGVVTGIDPSQSMVDFCRQRASACTEFITGTAQDLPFGDGAFDLVASSMAIHHIPVAARAEALQEMYRVLRPGGRLLIADERPPDSPILRRLLHKLGGNADPDDPHTLRGLVTESGFTITATGRHPLLHHIAARRPRD